MKLLAFSGKKQSGKDTAARFLVRNAREIFGCTYHRMPFAVEGPFGFDQTLESAPSVKTVYFGDPMKEFAHKYLGVEKHKLWGTDDQKNQLTHVRWETLPTHHKAVDRAWEAAVEASYEFELTNDEAEDYANARIPKGYMTGRQLLQYIGEELFLEMDPSIWIRQFEQAVQKAQYATLLLNPDPRKPEQIDCIHRLGGKVIRFLRDPYAGTDRHISETALDPAVYNQRNFDAVVDNRNIGVAETNKRVLMQLRHWGWVTKRIDLAKIDWNPPEVTTA